MTAAAFAQKIILSFHLSYLLIFFKSVSGTSFLGCSYRKEFCCWNRVRRNYWFPRILFFFFLSAQGAGGSRQENAIQRLRVDCSWEPGRATNICWIALQLLISKSSHKPHKVDLVISAFFLFHFHYGLLQNIEYPVLYSPCCLSIPYATVCICQSQMTSTLEIRNIGLPWWRSGWESACQCRGHGFGPWSGKIPHAAERLRPWATIAEPARLEPVLRNGRGRYSERPAHRDEEWLPLTATRETHSQHQRPNAAKNK